MFKRAGQPAGLHLFSEVDHFLLGKTTRCWGGHARRLADEILSSVAKRSLCRAFPD